MAEAAMQSANMLTKSGWWFSVLLKDTLSLSLETVLVAKQSAVDYYISEDNDNKCCPC